MKNFTIEYNPTVDDIKEMIKLDNQAYEEKEDCGVLEKCLEWKRKCPDLYIVIKSDDKVVGYINFVPITRSAFERFKSGELKDYDLLKSDILPYKKGKNYCLLMSIVMDKDFRISRALMFLFDGLKNKIADLKNRGITIGGVVADCVTFEGERMAQHFNGECLVQTPSGSKIYEFNF